MWRLAAGVLAALPVSAVMWFESVYAWFGVSGGDMPRLHQAIVALGLWAAVVAWSLHGTARAAGVVLRAARLGIAVSMALPVVAIGVLLAWEASEGRRDLGMGGMMLYSMPVVTFVAAIVLVMMFAAIRAGAAKRLAADDAHHS